MTVYILGQSDEGRAGIAIRWVCSGVCSGRCLRIDRESTSFERPMVRHERSDFVLATNHNSSRNENCLITSGERLGDAKEDLVRRRRQSTCDQHVSRFWRRTMMEHDGRDVRRTHWMADERLVFEGVQLALHDL